MDKNFIVVGDSMLDRYYEGPANRISPEASCPIVDVNSVMQLPGGAANVAMNLAALGHTVDLVTVLGGQDGDEGAEGLRGWFEQIKEIRTHIYHFGGCRTPIKNRVNDHNGVQLLRFDQQDSKPFWDKTVNSAILLKVEDLLVKAHESGEPSVLVLSDYGNGVLLSDELVVQLLGISRDLHIPSLVDPKSADLRRYRGATIVKPNLHEAREAVGPAADNDDAGKCAATLLQELHPDVDSVVVTSGSDGICIAMHDGQDILVECVPAYPARQFFNAVGAGDTVTALLAESICCKVDYYNSAHLLLRDDLIRASVGAGVVTGKPNTAVLSLWELDEALADIGVIAPSKSTDTDGLANVIEEARDRGEEIVFANGCFDMLHPGHIHFLTEAKKIGGMLIVGVNSDDSVTKCKGQGRPLIPLDLRIKALEALSCVDAVIPFDEDTPEELIRKLKPDWLLKGDEYFDPDGNVDAIPGARFVLANGRGVRFVKMLDGYSTTKLVNRELPPAAEEKEDKVK